MRYYLSAREGNNWHMMTYDIATGIWLREDDTHAIRFTRNGRKLCFLGEDKRVWETDGELREDAVMWKAQTQPFFETVEGRKRYSKILLRAKVAQGGWLEAQVRCDGGRWETVGRIDGNRFDVQPMAIVPQRCDRFEIRLVGKGHCKIYSILRRFSVRSDAV